MSTTSLEKLLRTAALLALVGLCLMVLSVMVPRPLPVVLAMTVGQCLGTLSLVLYGLAIVLDLKRANVLGESVAKDSDKEK